MAHITISSEKAKEMVEEAIRKIKLARKDINTKTGIGHQTTYGESDLQFARQIIGMCEISETISLSDSDVKILT